MRPRLKCFRREFSMGVRVGVDRDSVWLGLGQCRVVVVKFRVNPAELSIELLPTAGGPADEANDLKTVQFVIGTGMGNSHVSAPCNENSDFI